MSNAVVARITGPTYDEYGDPIEGDGEPETLNGCTVAPRYTHDVDPRSRQGVIEGLTLYAPPGTVIEPTDRFTVNGIEYEVDGEEWDWKSPYDGWNPGTEVALKRAAG